MFKQVLNVQNWIIWVLLEFQIYTRMATYILVSDEASTTLKSDP